MRSYTNIIVTNKASIQLANIVTYVLRSYADEFAAQSIIDDYYQLLDDILIVNDGLAVIEGLRDTGLNYRKKRFRRHKRILAIYWCDAENATIYIEGFYDARSEYLKRIGENVL